MPEPNVKLFPWNIPEERLAAANQSDTEGKTSTFRIRTFKWKNRIKKADIQGTKGVKGLLKTYDEYVLLEGRALAGCLFIILRILALPFYIAALPSFLIGLVIGIITFPIMLPIWFMGTFMQDKYVAWIEKRIKEKPDSMFTLWLIYRQAPDLPVYLGRENVVQVVKVQMGRKYHMLIFVLDRAFPGRLGGMSILPIMVGRRMHIVKFDGKAKALEEAAPLVEQALNMKVSEGKIGRTGLRV